MDRSRAVDRFRYLLARFHCRGKLELCARPIGRAGEFWAAVIGEGNLHGGILFLRCGGETLNIRLGNHDSRYLINSAIGKSNVRGSPHRLVVAGGWDDGLSFDSGHAFICHFCRDAGRIRLCFAP